jgi:hypothetical protein
MSPTYIYFIIFFCIAYLIITDQSVAKAFYMLTQLAKVQYEKTKWWIMHSPDNIIVRWLIHRRSMKMAKELMKEFGEKNK